MKTSDNTKFFRINCLLKYLHEPFLPETYDTACAFVDITTFSDLNMIHDIGLEEAHNILQQKEGWFLRKSSLHMNQRLPKNSQIIVLCFHTKEHGIRQTRLLDLGGSGWIILYGESLNLNRPVKNSLIECLHQYTKDYKYIDRNEEQH
jgi:hypothetical protein